MDMSSGTDSEETRGNSGDDAKREESRSQNKETKTKVEASFLVMLTALSFEHIISD